MDILGLYNAIISASPRKLLNIAPSGTSFIGTVSKYPSSCDVEFRYHTSVVTQTQDYIE